jgi:peroxiredoxin
MPDRLPPLVLIDEAGRHTDLDAVRSGRAAVVFFMRTASCPVCRSHVRSLVAMANQLAARDTVAVVVVPGSPQDAAAVRRLAAGRLTVVSSTDAHAAVGLGRTMLMQHSGTYVVDASGALRSRRSAAMPTASFSRSDILAAISG